MSTPNFNSTNSNVQMKELVPVIVFRPKWTLIWLETGIYIDKETFTTIQHLKEVNAIELTQEGRS